MLIPGRLIVHNFSSDFGILRRLCNPITLSLETREAEKQIIQKQIIIYRDYIDIIARRYL